jgi:hypothetical protein
MNVNADTDTPLPSWRQRPKPIGFEIAYRLDGETLEIDTTRKVDHVRLGSVEQVRFVYAPSNVTSKGFKTQLRLSDGKVITFGNLSWRSLTDIDRDDAGYHAFVTALSRTIARANPKARFLAGKPFALWLALAGRQRIVDGHAGRLHGARLPAGRDICRLARPGADRGIGLAGLADGQAEPAAPARERRSA